MARESEEFSTGGGYKQFLQQMQERNPIPGGFADRELKEIKEREDRNAEQ